MPDQPKPQIDKFKEAARVLETDDDPEHFKDRLGKLVKHKPVSVPLVYWKVGPMKRGPGYCARRISDGVPMHSDTYSTEAEVYEWCRERGLIQSPTKSNEWLEQAD